MSFSLNKRTGFFVKNSKDRLKVYYFFIDNERRLFYVNNMIRIEKAIKLSQNVREVSQRLERMNTKFYILSNIKAGPIELFSNSQEKTFVNQNYFQLQLKNQKQSNLFIFSLYDDDISVLQEFLQKYEDFLQSYLKTEQDDQTESKSQNNYDSLIQILVNQHKALEKETKYINKTYKFLNLIDLIDDIFAQNNNNNNLNNTSSTNSKDTTFDTNNNNHDQSKQFDEFQGNGLDKSVVEIYERKSQGKDGKIIEGQMLELGKGSTFSGNLLNGKPVGQGTEFLNEEGISYKGEFKQGRKHGKGYVVNSNLDMLYCEYINGQIVGI